MRKHARTIWQAGVDAVAPGRLIRAAMHVRGGKLRALCITGPEKFELLPDMNPCDGDVPGSAEGDQVPRSSMIE